MKVMKNATLKNSISENKSSRKMWMPRSLAIALLMLFCIPVNVMASQERFVLDFNDSHVRGHRGKSAIIFLKKILKEQYPWVKLKDVELKKVILVAKSKRGRGGAGLRVGKRATEMYEVSGRPRSFHDSDRSSFDRVKIWNPSYNSRGPWQLGLRGNFVVRKVVLVVDHHRKRDQYSRWERNR